MEYWVETEFNNTQDRPCSCRHLARFICREFNND